MDAGPGAAWDSWGSTVIGVWTFSGPPGLLCVGCCWGVDCVSFHCCVMYSVIASVGKVHFRCELVQSSVHKFLNEIVQLNVRNSNFKHFFNMFL